MRAIYLATATLLFNSTYADAFTISAPISRNRPHRSSKVKPRAAVGERGYGSENLMLLRSTTEAKGSLVAEPGSIDSAVPLIDDDSSFKIEEYDNVRMAENAKDLTESALSLRDKSQRASKIEEEKTMDAEEIIMLTAWMGALSAFLLANHFLGPFPENIATGLISVKTWGLMHGIGGMLFGGGIILTTCIELLVINSRNKSVWKFWFGKVPDLDSKIVLPALTASIVSGTALAVDHYDSLAEAPFHVVAALATLLGFAGWWAVTDVTTQGKATEKIHELTSLEDSSETSESIPGVLEFRKFSNFVSCGFVTALYFIMITKPGFTG